MSNTIEHRSVAIAVNRAIAFDRIGELDPSLKRHAWGSCLRTKPAMLVFVEQGCSNVFTEGRTARWWGLKFHGLRPMDQVIQASIGAEDGLVQIRETVVTAEVYISHYRHLIRNALSSTDIELNQLDFVLPEHFGVETVGKEHYHRSVVEHPLFDYLVHNGLLVIQPGAKEPVQIRCLGSDPLQWHAAMTFLYDVTDSRHDGEHGTLAFSIGKFSWLDRLHKANEDRSFSRQAA